MRKPSRTMPPRNAPSAIGQLAFWGVLGVALLGFVWLASLPAILMAAALVTLVSAATWLTARREQVRLLRMAGSRAGEGLCQFARSFDTRAVDTWVIRAVHDSLQHSLDFAHPAFPLRFSDRLNELLCDPDDLDMDLAPEIARRAGRSLDNTERNPYFGRVQSVADLVMFFNGQPRVQGGAGAGLESEGL